MSVDVDLLKRVTETEGDPSTADGEAVQAVLRVLHTAEEGGLDIREEPWLRDIYQAIRGAFYSRVDWDGE